MKTFIKTLGFMAVLAFVLVPAQALRAAEDNGVSFQTFYDQLSSEGTWFQTDKYGYVFQPNVSDPNWRPYTYGHWVNTDQGMTWVSDEPFGWATYHYGRWVNLDDYGWVWVPGYTWAPAWVSWRDSDDYYGWAPLPPETAVGIDFFDPGAWFGFGFHIGGDCDTAFGIGPACYNFCPVAYIGDPYCWRHFADRRDNFAIINRTRNVTNINVTNNPRGGRFGRVHADGPASLAAMNARSRTPIHQVSLASASTLRSNGRLHGNSLSVFAPRVDPITMKTARPHAVDGTLASTTVNRGTDINRPQAVTQHIRSSSPTAEQIHAAMLAQGNVFAGARIATANTQPSRPLSQPLTSFHANRVTGANPGGTTIRTEPLVSSVHPGNAGQAVLHPTPSVPHTSSSFFHPFTSLGNSYHRPSIVHQSAPVFHPQSVFHPVAPVQHFGGGAPAYHPQSSFHPFAPAPRFGGGAPAYHPSGGGPGSGGNGHKKQPQ